VELTREVVIVVAVIAVVVAFVLIRWGRRAEAAPPADGPVIRPRTIPMASRAEGDSDPLVQWLLEHAAQQTGVRVSEDALARDRIVKAAEKASEDLRTSGSAAINLPFLVADMQGPKHFAIRLQRKPDSTFEVLG
jgi:Hsp70 protein